MNPEELPYATWKKMQGGEWLLFGPERLMKMPGAVRVKKKDGSVEHLRVYWTSKPFDVDGVLFCLGRPEQKKLCENCGSYHRRADFGMLGGAACWDVGGNMCDCAGKLRKKAA